VSSAEIDIEKIKHEVLEACDLVWVHRNSPSLDYDPQKLINEALEKSRSIGFLEGEARCYLNLGMAAFIVSNNNDLAFEFFEKAISYFESSGNKKWLANSLITKAIVRNSTGSPEIALYDGSKGVTYYEENEADPEMPMAFYVMGTIYKDLKKYDLAENYFKRGIESNFEQDVWTGRLYTGLAGIYSEQGKFNEAIALIEESSVFFKRSNNRIGESRAKHDLGNVYRKLGNNQMALQCLTEALQIRKENNLKHFILGSIIDIAELHTSMGDLESAKLFYKEAEAFAIETQHSQRLSNIYKELAILHKRSKEHELAIEVYEKLLRVMDDLKLANQETQINQTQSKLLKEKEQEIERLRNIELKKAYELIEQRNKDIHDSISYAKRIQNALLAQQTFLNEHLPEHFLYFNPKDIVSGDFYWATHKDNKFYLAVCDSTGHGVPGAFMSLLNIGFLSEAINEKSIQKPNDVFDFVRKRLIDNISKEGQKDGFDGILLCIEKTSHGTKVSYAAANNIPVIVKEGKAIELEADRMPVGVGEKEEPFNLYVIDVKKGDMLFLYTDGYADQFGGLKGKKFRYRALNELLEANSFKAMDQQQHIVAKTFEEWRGNLEQIDDVCVVGIRL